MIYFVFYIFVIITLYAESRCKQPNKHLRALIAIVFSLFLGLRGANVGVDTPVYYLHFDYFGQRGCDFVEPGFDWIVRYCYAQGWKCWTMFLACSSLAIFFFHMALCKLPRKQYTVAAAMFYIMSFATLANGMRQVVVCGVFLYAISFFYECRIGVKNTLLYLTLILASTLMHASAILLLPLFLLCKVKLNRNIHLWVYLLSFCFIFIDISGHIPELELLERDYSRYATDSKDLVKQASWLGFSVTTLVNVLLFYLMYKTDAFKRYNTVANFVVLAFIFKNLGFNIPLVGRITIYFSWFVYIMVAYLYASINKRYSLTFLMIFVLYVAIFLNGWFSTANKLLPYNTYWEDHNYGRYIENDNK